MNVCRINGSMIADREALHRTLAEGLAFPDWYGGNLDALYDCLTELNEETELQILDFRALERNLGAYAERFRRVLEDADAEIEWLRISFE